MWCISKFFSTICERNADFLGKKHPGHPECMKLSWRRKHMIVRWMTEQVQYIPSIDCMETSCNTDGSKEKSVRRWTLSCHETTCKLYMPFFHYDTLQQRIVLPFVGFLPRPCFQTAGYVHMSCSHHGGHTVSKIPNNTSPTCQLVSIPFQVHPMLLISMVFMHSQVKV